MRRRPVFLPTVAAIIMVMLTVSLGNWQLRRAHRSESEAEQYDTMAKEPPVNLPVTPVYAPDWQYRRVRVEGRFDARDQIYLDNISLDDKVGYDVLTPMVLSGSNMHVLVNRGFVESTGDRSHLPQAVPPHGIQVVTGIAAIPPKRFLLLSGSNVNGRVWENLVLKDYASQASFPLQPVVILQDNDTNDGLIRIWPRPDMGVAMHYGYFFQWYAMAAAIIIIYIGLYVRRYIKKG
ncbi:MAG: SURF1 family protein [Pseudomonadota bacterium]|nr:SURF1 family protein [Pseudomonadota bacterium]